LVDAVQTEDVGAVQALLDSGVDPRTPSNDGLTPLLVASKEGKAKIVSILLKTNAVLGLECQDKQGQTPLFLAAWNGRDAVVDLLIEAGAYHLPLNVNGVGPLWAASERGHLNIVRKFLALGVGDTLELGDIHDQTALFQACWQGHTEVVKTLLDAGANPETINRHNVGCVFVAVASRKFEILDIVMKTGAAQFADRADYQGKTALFHAAKNGDGDMCVLLLEHGAEVDAVAQDKSTPLMAACEGGHAEAAHALLAKGAKWDTANDTGNTVISLAAKSGSYECVQLLLAAGASPDHFVGSSLSPLVQAATHGGYAIVDALLLAGASVDKACGSDKVVALAGAASAGDLAVVERLVLAGADVRRADKVGKTALLAAAACGAAPVVRFLLDNGARTCIEARDRNFHTPLWRAAMGDHTEVVEMLLKEGAFLGVKSSTGESLEGTVLRHSIQPVMELIIEFGGDPPDVDGLPEDLQLKIQAAGSVEQFRQHRRHMRARLPFVAWRTAVDRVRNKVRSDLRAAGIRFNQTHHSHLIFQPVPSAPLPDAEPAGPVDASLVD
jgi:ankyrin repeat protein